MRGLNVRDLSSENDFENAIANLSSAFEAAYSSLQAIDGGMANQFDERFKDFSEPMLASEISVALCEHYEAIQKGKSDTGKRAWFDRLGEDRIYLRHQYRESIAEPMPGRFVHDYRGRPIRNFYKDLR